MFENAETSFQTNDREIQQPRRQKWKTRSNQSKDWWPGSDAVMAFQFSAYTGVHNTTIERKKTRSLSFLMRPRYQKLIYVDNLSETTTTACHSYNTHTWLKHVSSVNCNSTWLPASVYDLRLYVLAVGRLKYELIYKSEKVVWRHPWIMQGTCALE